MTGHKGDIPHQRFDKFDEGNNNVEDQANLSRQVQRDMRRDAGSGKGAEGQVVAFSDGAQFKSPEEFGATYQAAYSRLPADGCGSQADVMDAIAWHQERNPQLAHQLDLYKQALVQSA